ncbi:hypothetical protein [Oceanicaulis sp.]|uniref:hypothetical protein n=1 Tax=Oceanicaulis sp. TaxID=1924941 RepID=UPI003F70BC03
MSHDEKLKDKIDLRLCELVDIPPHGEGRSMGEAARILSREFPKQTFTRNKVLGQWRRIKAAAGIV